MCHRQPSPSLGAMPDRIPDTSDKPWEASSYWDGRFATLDTPWELGRPSSVLLEALDAAQGLGLSVRGARTLSPGCGRGEDAIALAERGAEVTALDWSQCAIAELSKRIESLGPAVRGRITVASGDFFAEAPGPLDLVVEHTFFCALDPSRRPQYAEALGRIVRPGGFLVGNFFVVSEGEIGSLPNMSLTRQGVGPPFAATAEEIRGLFSPSFQLFELRPALHPEDDRRPGVEWVGILRRR